MLPKCSLLCHSDFRRDNQSHTAVPSQGSDLASPANVHFDENIQTAGQVIASGGSSQATNTSVSGIASSSSSATIDWNLQCSSYSRNAIGHTVVQQSVQQSKM